MADMNQNNSAGTGNLTPLLIIAAVAVVVVVGIAMIVRSGNDTSGSEVAGNASSSPSTAGTAPERTPLPNWSSAPPGAVPPHFKGSENSPVLVEEFADFQCPTCALVHPRMNEINARFGSKIKFVYRNYPLTNLHANAYDAAVAGEAAGLQGKFWEMQNQLFANQRQWSISPDARKLFAGYAQKIGLDVDKFNNDLLAMNTKLRVDADMRRGRILNITGTPTILVNGKPVGSFEVSDISNAIDAEIAVFAPKSESSDPPEDSKKDGK